MKLNDPRDFEKYKPPFARQNETKLDARRAKIIEERKLSYGGSSGINAKEKPSVPQSPT